MNDWDTFSLVFGTISIVLLSAFWVLMLIHIITNFPPNE